MKLDTEKVQEITQCKLYYTTLQWHPVRARWRMCDKLVCGLWLEVGN